jgi:hypothetical protein
MYFQEATNRKILSFYTKCLITTVKCSGKQLGTSTIQLTERYSVQVLVTSAPNYERFKQAF